MVFHTSHSSKEISDFVKDPFSTWKEGVAFDQSVRFQESSSKFKAAAQEFYDSATRQVKVARAYYEYSSLMDAYSLVQLGRLDIHDNDFDPALAKFDEAARILRSTIHFGFLAPFISACATAETTDMMEKDDPECLQGYKNAIALYEQSKLALSFRDYRHQIVTVIDAYIRRCISRALNVESFNERLHQNIEASKDKEKRSRLVQLEFEGLLRKVGLGKERLLYLPLDDYRRAEEGAFVLSFPDTSSLWLLNLGNHAANIEKLGDYDSMGVSLKPKDSMKFAAELFGSGRIRVTYKDVVTGRKFDEGCVTAI